MQVAILYNTFSAKGKGKVIAQQIAVYCQEKDISYRLFENDWPEEAKNADCIALVGGDGTMNYFLNRFPIINKPILFFPGGTGNDFYWKVYNKNKVVDQLELLKQCVNKNATIKEVDVATCTLDKNNLKYYINGVGLGFDGEVLQSMNAIRFVGGFLGYYLVVLKNIFIFKEPSYEMQIDEQAPLKKQALTIVNIANSSRTGGGFLISPQAEIDDGKLNLLYCNVPSILKRLALFLKVGSGKHIKSKLVQYQEINRVRIKSDSTVMAQLDGELIEAKEFEIGLSDWKLSVVI